MLSKKALRQTLGGLSYLLAENDIPPEAERRRIGAEMDAKAEAEAKAKAECKAKSVAKAKARAEALAQAKLARQLGIQPDELEELERQWKLLVG